MYRRTKALLAGLAIVVASATTANAMTVASWDHYEEPGDQAFTPPSGSAANVTASNMTRGAGLTPVASLNSLTSAGWDGTATSPAVDDDYVSFGFTVDPGFVVALDALIIGTKSSPTGPGTIGLYSSLDGFATPIHTFVQPGDNYLNALINLSGLSGVTGSVEFRLIEIGNIRADGSGATADDGLFSVVDNFHSGIFTDTQFTGEVRTVPVPAALPLLASALAGLGVIGWRKRKAA